MLVLFQKSTNNRIYMYISFIFNCTNLFAGDVSKNFIILDTYPDKNTMKSGILC